MRWWTFLQQIQATFYFAIVFLIFDFSMVTTGHVISTAFDSSLLLAAFWGLLFLFPHLHVGVFWVSLRCKAREQPLDISVGFTTAPTLT